MDQIIAKSEYRLSTSVKATDTPDGVVLLDIEHGMCFPLDQVGTIIWKRLQQRCDTDEIAKSIADTYQIPREQALSDVREFVQQLQQQKLLLSNEGKVQSRWSLWIASLGAVFRPRRRHHTDH